jgi:hypothetical protein
MVPGFVVPMPTRPRLFITKTFDPPEALLKEMTLPAPSCWTDRALPELVLPNTRTLELFKITGTELTP